MDRRRRIAQAAAAFLLVFMIGAAVAQTYPARPIRVIVPFSPGGAADILARVIAHRLTESWGQQVVVDNRAGAGGIIGSDLVAKAQPDGHTLLVTSSGHAINATLYTRLPYDTLKDFAAVAPIAEIANVLIVNANVPAKTVAELIHLAKSKPGELKFGSAGAGSTLHLAAELFKLMANVDMIHVPYKGNPQAITDLLSGAIDMVFPPAINVTPLRHDKRIRILAVCTPKRSPALPDVPTLAEAGLAGYAFESWWGMFGPAKMPAAVVAKLNGEMRRIVGSPEVVEVFGKQGAQPLSMTQEEFSKFVRAETEKMGKIVKASGARID